MLSPSLVSLSVELDAGQSSYMCLLPCWCSQLKSSTAHVSHFSLPSGEKKVQQFDRFWGNTKACRSLKLAWCSSRRGWSVQVFLYRFQHELKAQLFSPSLDNKRPFFVSPLVNQPPPPHYWQPPHPSTSRLSGRPVKTLIYVRSTCREPW